MRVAGIDIDTHNVHVALLDENGLDADYLRFGLELTGVAAYHEKARRMRELLPPRGHWRDRANVSLIAIEEPIGNTFRGVVPQAVIRGAVLACLPRDEDVRVVLIRPADWRKWSLGGGFPGKGNANKEAVAEWARGEWRNRPAGVDQNALDAYCIARAARALRDHGRPA